MASSTNDSNIACIIKTGSTAIDWFTKRSEIYLLAEQKGLKSYIVQETGNNSNLQSVTNLDNQLKSDLMIFKNTLKEQNDAEQKNLVNDLNELVKDTLPYIYELSQVPVSIDPAVLPGTTEADYALARSEVYLPEKAFRDYCFQSKREVPVGNAERTTLAISILPSNYFSPFNGTALQKARATATTYIPKHLFYKVIEKEAIRDPRIIRYDPTDDVNIDQLKAKLTVYYRNKAEKDIKDQSYHHFKEVSRINDINGKILAFFTGTIAGVTSSVAADVIRKQEWSKVMTVLNKSFTDQLTNTNQTTFLQKLLDLKLESNESIQHFNERVRSIVSAIQEINQVIESKLTRNRRYIDLTSTQCQGLLELTDDDFIRFYPDSKAYVSESIILQSLIKSCSDTTCRLHVAADRFKIRQHSEPSLTVSDFFKDLRFGEDILPEAQQVRLNVYETNYVKPNNKNNKKKKNGNSSDTANTDSYHCAFHSHNGQVSNHNTDSCKAINQGLTITDPKNSKWQVRKSNKLHFTPFVNRDSKKDTNTSDNNAKWKGKEPCAICLALSKKDSNFKEFIMYNHNTASHDSNKGKRNGKSKSTSEYSTSSNAGSEATKEATSKLESILSPLAKTISQFVKTMETRSTKRKLTDSDEVDVD